MSENSEQQGQQPTDFYGSRRGKGIQRNAEKHTIKSPVTGENISYTLKYLDGGPELLGKLFKSVYNRRSFEHLTREAVSDIFDGIEQTGGNTKEVVGVVDGDVIELLEGSRRTFICSQLPQSKLLIKVFDSLTDEERQHYASTSDEYDGPNAIDTGFSLLKLEERLIKQDKPHTVRELASIYKISTGSVSEYMNFARLPKCLFALFPGLNFLPIRFMRKMRSHQELTEFESTLKSFEPITTVAGQPIVRTQVESACKALQQEIVATLEAMASGIKKSEPVESAWRGVKPVRGINLKVNDAGKVTLSFTEANVSKKVLEQIMAAIVSEGNG